MSFKASAPGSLMLLGEYAVLHGKHALVCAIDKRMTVTLQPRSDSIIKIFSSLGKLEIDIHDKIIPVAPFQFVLTTLSRFQKKIRFGCDINIQSEFSHQVGFASSAAVTVATLSVLSKWLNLYFSKEKMIREARAIVRQVQTLGSGADVAACVLGGMVGYRAEPLSMKKYLFTPPLTVVYSGSKTPTVEAVKKVLHHFRHHPKIFQKICSAIDDCSLAGMKAVEKKNVAALGEVMNIQQGLMDALGVNTPLLNGMIDELRNEKNILGAKISGSGLGDCIVGVSQENKTFVSSFPQADVIPVEITTQGVICEKI